MLERKRLLKIKEQIVKDGQRVFIYEQPATGDLFTIIDPNLQLKQLEQVQHDVAALLEHGLNPPPTPPPGPAEAAVPEPACLGAIMHRDHGRDSQHRGLRDDEQPEQASRPRGTSPRFTTGHDDIGIRIAGTVGHFIIAGGRAGDVNRSTARPARLTGWRRLRSRRSSCEMAS